MKNAINNLLAADRATLKLNNFATLCHERVTIMNKKYDNLILTISIQHFDSFIIPIKARDYGGIISEAAAEIKKAFAEAGDEYAKQLVSGYIEGRLTVEAD